MFSLGKHFCAKEKSLFLRAFCSNKNCQFSMVSFLHEKEHLSWNASHMFDSDILYWVLGFFAIISESCVDITEEPNLQSDPMHVYTDVKPLVQWYLFSSMLRDYSPQVNSSLWQLSICRFWQFYILPHKHVFSFKRKERVALKNVGISHLGAGQNQKTW